MVQNLRPSFARYAANETNVFHTLVMVKFKPSCRKSRNESSMPYTYAVLNSHDHLKNKSVQTPPVPGGPVWLAVC